MSFLSYPPPRYGGTRGLVNAVFRPADTPPDLVSGGADGGVTAVGAGQRTHYLATGAGTGGQFGLYRVEMPPHGRGPAAHFHRTITESFYVLDGTVALFDGTAWRDGGPGDFLHVPIGGLHGFHNPADAPASLLLLFTPGAPREAYFEGIPRVAEMDEEERLDFFLQHDNHWV